MEAHMKIWDLRSSFLLPLIIVVMLSGCQRETPTEKAQPPQPASTVDRAAQQAVDAIKTPMDKARGVEGTLDQAGGRTADKVREATQ
jgi:uncharacterized lipoprotein YajG